MDLHRLGGRSARRRTVAGVVLAASLVASVWIGTYTEVSNCCSGPGINLLPLQGGSFTPAWTLPLAIAVGIGGALVALLVCRPRLVRR